VLGSIGGLIVLAVFTRLFLQRRAEKKKKQNNSDNHPSKELSSENRYKHEPDGGAYHGGVVEMGEANNYSELPASVSRSGSSSSRTRHREEEGGLPSRSDRGVNPGLVAELDQHAVSSELSGEGLRRPG